MSKSLDPWEEGRRAWKRLNGWQNDAPPTPGHPDDGDAALAALTDVGVVHRVIDQVELIAVRTARRHGKSWAEIATRLGVTRQSAWERWRDLDNAETPVVSGGDVSGRDAAMRAAEADAAVEMIARSAGALRRKASIMVPNVIGMSWADARRLLKDSGLTAVEPGSGRPPTGSEVPAGAVTDQSPESGARVPAGSLVTLWVGRGGGSAGVREPRRPMPRPKSAREERERADDAVG